ncbi:MAG: isoaspartyl peptidase/L-asparaginase [Bacteroidetes bacterium]|nr:MAG: isoaspartyl peptidase/L-asparaginase [Bacteroidota bacterium]
MKKITVLLLICLFSVPVLFAQKNKIAIAIHGGAGTIKKENMTPELEKSYHEILKLALDSGYLVLEKGGTSLDAIEVTIKILENSPLFNAGKGAVFANNGKNELDAAIMDGKTLKAGAVAGLTTIKNPIMAAKEVMLNSKHVLLTGEGAEVFAKKQGLQSVDPNYFHTDKRFEQLQKTKAAEQDTTGSIKVEKTDKYGTVGAVALDQYGNLAAGTSTGGMNNKKYGRVGDTPIIGAGTYANNETCAISCTGHGEFFIRAVVAYDISALMEYKNLSLKKASEKVVLEKLVKMGGEGGLIAIDKNGNVSLPFNSEGMYRGYKKANGELKTAIYKE